MRSQNTYRTLSHRPAKRTRSPSRNMSTTAPGGGWGCDTARGHIRRVNRARHRRLPHKQRQGHENSRSRDVLRRQHGLQNRGRPHTRCPSDSHPIPKRRFGGPSTEGTMSVTIKRLGAILRTTRLARRTSSRVQIRRRGLVPRPSRDPPAFSSVVDQEMQHSPGEPQTTT